MSASLGGLLKDYRLQKNISQLEIAFSMGWKEPSRLSRIEQGRVGKPKREVLNKIIETMKLKEDEKNRLLLTGSYIPTVDDIQKITILTKNILDNYQFPAVLFDFTWRIIDANKLGKNLYYVEKVFGRSKKFFHPNLIQLYFDNNYPLNQIKDQNERNKWQKHLIRLLIHFQIAQQSRTKERWYMELISNMMDNELFRSLWKKSQDEEVDVVATNYSDSSFVDPINRKKLNFESFTVNLVKDPRFDIEFHTPSDLETFRYFQKK